MRDQREVPSTAPRSILFNSLLSGLSSVVRGALAFGTGIVLARGLTPGPRGELGFVLNTVGVLVLLAGFGVSPAMTRAKAKDGRSVRELWAASTFLGVTVGGAASAAFLLAYWVHPGTLLAGLSALDAAAIALLVPPSLALTHWSVAASLEDRIPEFVAATLTAASLFFVGAVIVDVTIGLTSARAVILWGATSLVPVLIVASRRPLTGLWRSRGLALALLRFGVRANVATVALILAWRLDVFLVKGYRGLAELGLYAVAVSLAEIVLQIAVSVRVALTPMQGSADGREQLVSVIATTSRLIFGIGGAVATLALLLAHPLMLLLYGSTYARASSAVQWLLPGIVALVVQGPFIDYLLVEGKVRAVTAATVLGLAINIGVDVAMLPGHSYVWAAIGSTAAYVASCSCCVLLFAHHTKQRVTDLLVPRAQDLRLLRNALANLGRAVRTGRTAARPDPGAASSE